MSCYSVCNAPNSGISELSSVLLIESYSNAAPAAKLGAICIDTSWLCWSLLSSYLLL